MTQNGHVRRAEGEDVAELVRLRGLLFEDLGGDFHTATSAAGDEWRHNLATVLKERLAADSARILVIDGEIGLAACGIGTVDLWFPGPHSPRGRIGHVIGVVTDPAYRRRGYGRAIMQELLGWFRQEDVARVDLFSSREAEPLYRDLGFFDHPDPALVWRP